MTRIPGWVACCGLALTVVSCDRESALATRGSVSASGGSRRIAASGEVFQLGSSGGQSLLEESPGWMRFTYDFWLDTTEVTQAEFQSLMGRNPSPTSVTGPSKPVVNVSWFDAILYCNARSKRDHLDTVYEYASLSTGSTGFVWNIQGLTSNLDRSGWRLPTEAEWEYAARAGSMSAYPWGELVDSAKAVEYAWYQKNAVGSLHEVARLAPNAWGFYDMAGNAMEWVQDWKGPFPKDTLTNFAGLDAPGDVPEAPLKGGSYNYGLDHLRPSARTGTYAAYRSSRAEYVGFRCARGAFTAAYTNISGQSVQALPVSILRSDVAKILGAQSARLLFLNRSNGTGVLSWIDYGEANPVVRSLPDKDPVFHPVISPDGQWVAWCTVMEGGTGASRIKARRLSKNDSMVFDLGIGAIPRWWVNGTDTFLIRTSSAMDNTGSDWGSGKTTAQRWSNGALRGSVEAWANSGSYHDGRSGQYLYTGYRRLEQYNVVDGSSRTLFRYPQNGKFERDTSQVCNASAAPDGSGRVLFLDFGYSGTSTVVKRPYGIHEIAFMADSLGNVLKSFSVAVEKSQWDHLEWSNNPQWAVGMALDGNAYHEIHLLNLNTGKVTPIVKGSELWMPTLWVGSNEIPILSSEVNADSAGAWNTPASGETQASFAAKMQKFWPIRDRLRIVAVGSSRVMTGILPEEFTSGFAYNWGFSGSEPIGDRVIIEQYLLPHAVNAKVVILSLMPEWIFTWRGDIAWNTNIQSLGYRYDQSHGYWQTGIPSGYLETVAKRVFPMKFDSLGGFIQPSFGWGRDTLIVPLPSESFESETFKANWSDLISIAETCKARNVHLLLVNFPGSPYYANTPSMGMYGPTWATYHELTRRILAYAASNSLFHFYDANQGGHHDYPESAAANHDHLSTYGAKILTKRIDSLIQTFSIEP